jgi:hypothetical protein
MIIAFLFFSVIFAARQLSPSIRGIEKFSRELEMRMREKKHPQRVVIPKEERHPVTGDVHCATMPVYEHHARYFNISAATCGLSQCDDPTVRELLRYCSSSLFSSGVQFVDCWVLNG